MTIGEKIHEARLKAGISQEKLGEMIGTSKQNISYWEAERHHPDFDSLVKISLILDIPFSEFFKITIKENYIPKSNRLTQEYFRYLNFSESPVSCDMDLFWLSILDDYFIGGEELLIKMGYKKNMISMTEAMANLNTGFIKELKEFNSRYKIVEMK